MTDNWSLTLEKNSNINAFGRWLDLILAIAGDKEAPASELARILGTSTRNVYYVLDALANYGFVVNRLHSMYNLDASSPFFRQIASSVSFTQEQAAYIYNLLCRKDVADNAISGMLRVKLQRFYHLNEYVGAGHSMGAYRNTVLLKKAVDLKRVVILHDYASSHSQTVSDRMVEPFMFLGDDNDIRAYEIKSGMNKSFKIARIGNVEILDTDWYNEDRHREVFTDMFLFAGEERHHVSLRLDLVAHNLMLEEYPHSEPMMAQDDSRHWLMQTDVADYAAIARFVVGLYDDIEVLGDDGLKQYIDAKIRRMRHE